MHLLIWFLGLEELVLVALDPALGRQHVRKAAAVGSHKHQCEAGVFAPWSFIVIFYFDPLDTISWLLVVSRGRAVLEDGGLFLT